MTQYIKYVHTKSAISDIKDLVGRDGSLLTGVTVGELVCSRAVDGVTNLQRIYDRYLPSDGVSKSVIDGDLAVVESLPVASWKAYFPSYTKIKVGTELVIPAEFLCRDIPIASGLVVADRKRVYVPDVILSLMQNDGYRMPSSDLTDLVPTYSVIVWCRSLGTGDYLDGKLIDITRFVSQLSMAKAFTDSSFSIDLSYTVADFDESMASILSDAGVPLSVYDSIVNRIDDIGVRRRNSSQMQKILSTNDIVFIRFNKLEMEKDGGGIAGKVFDKIGMIDSISDSYSVAGAGVAVNLSGTDLTKLLSGDGSSIYEGRYISSGETYESIEQGSDIFRLFGKHVSMFQLTDQTLGDQISFILDYMTRMVICNNSLPVNDGRNRKIYIGEGSSIVPDLVSGIYRMVDVYVDPAVADKRTFNSEIGNSFSSILDQIQTLCPDNFTEVITDTYGDKFGIVVRRPPYDMNSVVHYATNRNVRSCVIKIRESDIISDSLGYSPAAYSWYKLNYRMLTSVFESDFMWMIPAVYFKEYASVFGDRPLKVIDPFVDFRMKVDASAPEDKVFGRDMILSALNDFKFIIESNQYLPFSRTGSLSLNGNRTIKVGMWVYNEATDEMMHVDRVEHSIGVSSGMDFTTRINVSRVMMVSEIRRYFSIIDLNIGSLGVRDDFAKFIDDTLRGWKVNMSNFEYFMRRRQNG